MDQLLGANHLAFFLAISQRAELGPRAVVLSGSRLGMQVGFSAIHLDALQLDRDVLDAQRL